MNENIEVMQNPTPIQKKSKGPIIIIIILLIALLGTVGYILVDKGVIFKKEEVKTEENSNKEQKEEIKKEENNNKENNKVEEDLKEISLTEYEKEEFTLYDQLFPVPSSIDSSMYDKNYFDDLDNKFYFAWANIPNSSVTIPNNCRDDIGATGLRECRYDIFKKYYKTIYGENFDETKLKSDSFTNVKDGWIYGSKPSGMIQGQYQYSFKKLIYDNNSKTYKVIYDFEEFRGNESPKKLGTATLEYVLDQSGFKQYKSFIIQNN